MSLKLLRKLRQKEKEAEKARTVLMWVSSLAALPLSLVSLSLSIIYVMRECDLTMYHVLFSWVVTVLLGVYVLYLANKADALDDEVTALRVQRRLRGTYR